MEVWTAIFVYSFYWKCIVCKWVLLIPFAKLGFPFLYCVHLPFPKISKPEASMTVHCIGQRYSISLTKDKFTCTKGQPVGWGAYVGLLHWRNQSGRSFPISLSIRTQTISLLQYGNCSFSAGEGVPQELDWSITGGSVMSYSSALGPHKCPLLLKLFI